jgi:hypothetical protein
MRRLVALALIVAGLLLGMAATRWLTLPPPLRAENGSGQFDAQRAKARLARILGTEAPHPADSAPSDPVRDRLVAELRAMGLQPRVDDRFACNNLFKQRGVSCARVRNVLVTIGPANGAKHLLVNSHYDSVPVGPGASDAGLGVAAMLEAASLLKDRQLARPVTFLFNEGEELGLIGARAFLQADPLSGEVDTLINLEARGTTGPVNMFETSLPNPAAVRAFKQSVTNPIANSLAVSAYRLIPNYTDVNSFAEERRWLTLNFAPIGNETRYHSPGDNLAAMDLATLQHMGDQLLQAGGVLAVGPAPAQDEGDTLFMNVGTSFLLALPLLLGLAMAGLALILLLRRLWAEKGWTALLLFTAALGLGTASAWAGLSLVGSVREGQFWRANPVATELAIYAGVIAAGVALIGISRFRLPQLRSAFWLLFLLLGLLVTIWARGALIYFILPPLLYALAVTVWPRSEAWGRNANLLAALILFVTFGAAVGLIQDLLNGGPLWIFALLGGLMLLPWLIEARPLLTEVPKTRVLAAALAFAVVAWVPAAIAPAYSGDRQQQWSLQYIVDSSARQPVWSVVNDRRLLPSQWRRFGDWRFGTLPFSRRQRWIAPAPLVAGLTPARATLVEQSTVAGGRLLRFRIDANGSNEVELSAAPEADIRFLGAPGQMRRASSPGSSGRFRLSCSGRSCDGQNLQMLVGPKPIDFMLTDTRWSLPPAAAPLKAAQPANARAQYVPDSTLLLSRITA